MLSTVTFAQMSYSTEASIPEASRQGRDNQKYAATGERLVAGCVFALLLTFTSFTAIPASAIKLC